MATQIHKRTCNLCEAMCGVAIEHDGERVLSIRGDEEDPFSEGHICPKAVALKELHEDPDRLRRPQKRVGDRWEACSWDEALDATASRLTDIQKRHGRDSVAVYVGNPTAHNAGILVFGIGFLEAMRTRNRYSATSVDQLPHMLAALEMFGHQLLMPVPDVDHSDYLLMLGANPLVSNGSIMTAPGIKRRLKALCERGRFVVVDPRHTETAKLAHEHVYIRPGGDALWLAALIHELFRTKRVRPGRVGALCDGLDELESLMAPFSPDAVAPATGVAADVTRRIARELSEAKRPCVYGRVGVCTQTFGGLNGWLLNAINVCLGSLDERGGLMFTKPAADVIALASRIGQSGHFDKGRSRVRGLPEFGGEYPVITLADEIETPGEGQIRALVTIAGNPVLSTPNGHKLDAALSKLEFMASLDIYRNETTRHAHYIMPPTSQLEQSHYDLAFHLFAVRNTAKYSAPLFEPPPDSKADWQILLELTTRIKQRRGGFAGLTAPLLRAGLGRLGPDGAIDQLLRWGPYGKRWLGNGGSGLRLRTLKDNPSGVDLGALEPCFPERLFTKGKRIDLCPKRITRDMPRLAAALAATASLPPVGPGPSSLTLIGRRELRTNNSWIHNTPAMAKGRDRCSLIMHPDDARARGLEDGAQVVIRSRVGEVIAPLSVSDGIMNGVVSLPHGFGHGRPGVQMDVAAKEPGVSVNDLTDEAECCALTGMAVLNGVPVTVHAAG